MSENMSVEQIPQNESDQLKSEVGRQIDYLATLKKSSQELQINVNKAVAMATKNLRDTLDAIEKATSVFQEQYKTIDKRVSDLIHSHEKYFESFREGD